MFAAAFSLAFHGLLRVGELVIHPNSSSRVLQSSEVNVDRAQGAINITITYSKTYQMGRGTVLNISRVGDQTCPFDKIVAVISYPDIKRQPAILSSDGVHLSKLGNSILLNTLQG